MTNVYAIKNDGFKYQELRLYIDDIIEARPSDVSEQQVFDFSIENLKMSGWWPQPDPLFVAIEDDPRAVIPDISEWIDASLVFSGRAYRLFSELMGGLGEFLPIKVKNETFYIFNCLTFGEEVLEQCEKEYYEGEELGYKKIVFSSESIRDKLVFKSAINSCVTLFCSERFKELTLDFELTGIAFDSSEVATC